MSLNPPLMWAQDRKKVFVTLKLQDVRNEEIVFNEGSFVFRGLANGNQYNYELELFGDILKEDKDTKYVKYGRYLQLTLRKSNNYKWWPRLAKTPKKLGNVGIDWEKWIDDEISSDDEEIPKKEIQKIESDSSADNLEEEEKETSEENNQTPAENVEE